ncbi:hypothetical protein [Micromonospora sp. WMMD980]|uniref:hypothetical protein n=1 Tax=Micromonospora sp. WMMD980 TaxID=3016088 RepID=UPI002417D2B0|nr:hypothetical protein [Micromonospora sp. WMMD980]MDG4799045.1 hypothetical protein [Micromonospora sp. WMMD980]
MGAVRKYHVTHNGHRTIMRLNDTDVKLYPGAELVDESATAESESAEEPTDAEPESKPATKAAATKTRTAADKTRSAGGDKAS